MKKIILLGDKKTTEIALRIIKKYFKKEIEILGFVSNKNFYNSKIKKKFLKNNTLKNTFFISNEKRNEKLISLKIKSLSPDYLISIQHKWILSNKILELVGNKCLNLHNAKLPNYKGYNSINFAIANNDKKYTSTIHWVSEQVDEGDIAFESSTNISKYETAESLYKKSLKCAEEILRKLFLAIIKNNIPKKKIKKQGKFYSKDSIEKLRIIDPKWNCKKIDRIVRACYFPPYEQAYYLKSKEKKYLSPEDVSKTN